MTEFTDALLALTREQQAAVASDTTCDVNAVLARVVEDQRSVSPGKRIVLEIEAGTNLQVAAPESMVAMTIGNPCAMRSSTARAAKCCAARRATSWS
jgi:hypothetical protein